MRRVETSSVGASGVVALALLAGSCGGAGSPRIAGAGPGATRITATTVAQSGSPAPRGGGNQTVMMVGDAARGARFAACMRSHAEPSFPDPDRQGTIRFGAVIDPRSPRFRSAMGACRRLLPASFGQPPTPALLAHVQQQLLAFSTCMRRHGIEDFPDPSGAALPRIPPVGDLDPANPRFRDAYRACSGHLPSGLPGKALGGLAPPAP